jgi:putative addiction module CopG family antidote
MAGTAKLSIKVSAKRAATIRSVVKRGDYDSADEVVNTALKLWEIQRAEEIELLRKAWKDGIASGTASGEWNMRDFLKSMRKRKPVGRVRRRVESNVFVPLIFAEIKREARRRLKLVKLRRGRVSKVA